MGLILDPKVKEILMLQTCNHKDCDQPATHVAIMIESMMRSNIATVGCLAHCEEVEHVYAELGVPMTINILELETMRRNAGLVE